MDQGRSRVSASEERKASPIAVRIGSIDWERAPQVESIQRRKFLVEKENGREENRKGPLFEGGQRLREFGMREPKSKNEVRVKLEESLGPTVWRRNG